MLISHFNRYFEKHGRKTYIVLGVIISLMFVVFISGGAGDIFSFLGNGRPTSYGTMYGKKLKIKDINKKMQETSLVISLTSPYMQQLDDRMIFQETLNRMRMLKEAKNRGMAPITDEELADRIREIYIFHNEEGAFDMKRFARFKDNLTAQGMTAQDFDRIIRESMIIDRLGEEITKDVTVDDAEAASYIEKYTTKFAAFPVLAEDSRPTQDEIADFFAKRSSEISLPDGRSAIVAQFSVQNLLDNLPAELQAEIEPKAEEVSAQYEKYSTTTYKDQEFAAVSGTIATMLKNRNARNYLEKQAAQLSEKFADMIDNETPEDRQRRFLSEAGKVGAALTTTGYVTGTAAVPGIGENEMSLAEKIRGLEKVGQVSAAAYMTKGPAVAYLRERRATALPTELDKEISELIADKLMSEKALAMYNEKVGPFRSDVATSDGLSKYMQLEYARLQSDTEMSDEQKQVKLYEYQSLLQDFVMPFLVRESRSFSAAVFPYDAYAAEVKIDDDMLREEYQAHLADYQKKEVRLARIQMNVGGLSADEAKAKRDKLAALLAEVGEGADFEALVAANSEVEDSIDKDFVEISKYPAVISAKLEGLAAGQISEIIEMPESYVLVKVLERRDGRSFDEVKGELTAAVRDAKTREMAGDEAERLSDILATNWYDKNDFNGQTDGKEAEIFAAAEAVLKESTSKFSHARFVEFADVDSYGYLNPEFGRDENMAAVVFRTSAASPISIAVGGQKGVYVCCLKGIVPASLRDPAKDQVAMSIMKRIYVRESGFRKAEARAQAEATRINAALAEQKAFAEAAGSVTFSDVPEFSRFNAQALAQTLRAQDVNTLLNSYGKAAVNTVSAPIRTDSGAALLYLVSKVVPDDEQSKAMLENVKNYLLNRNKQEALNKFSLKLEEESQTMLDVRFFRQNSDNQ